MPFWHEVKMGVNQLPKSKKNMQKFKVSKQLFFIKTQILAIYDHIVINIKQVINVPSNNICYVKIKVRVLKK